MLRFGSLMVVLLYYLIYLPCIYINTWFRFILNFSCGKFLVLLKLIIIIIMWAAEGSVFGAISLWLFCLCMTHLRNRWMDLHQIQMENTFSPSLGRVWRSRSKVIVTRDKKIAFSFLSVACLQFMFGKTCLASSFIVSLVYHFIELCFPLIVMLSTVYHLVNEDTQSQKP